MREEICATARDSGAVTELTAKCVISWRAPRRDLRPDCGGCLHIRFHQKITIFKKR